MLVSKFSYLFPVIYRNLNRQLFVAVTKLFNRDLTLFPHRVQIVFDCLRLIYWKPRSTFILLIPLCVCFHSKERVTFAEEAIFEQGTTGTEMFFVYSGVIEIRNDLLTESNGVVAALSNGL